MKALSVEDNELMRRLIKSMIGGLAEVVIECGTGDAAFGLYVANQPDWVLMDIQLPGLDGITATSRIKADYPDAHVLIVTDHGDDQLREAARNAGACGYVLKENLMDVRRWLQPVPDFGVK